MIDATAPQIAAARESWRHGASMTSAADASGIPLASVATLYAQWDENKQRSPAPHRKRRQTETAETNHPEMETAT